MNEEKKPRLDSNTINGIVILFYRNLLTISPNRYTNALMLCENLARRLGETEYLFELEEIDRSCTAGYPLSTVEATRARGMAFGYSMAKEYNYGWKNPRLNLGDMTLGLHRSLRKIFDIFTAICVKHDIDTSIVMPMVEEIKEDVSGM